MMEHCIRDPLNDRALRRMAVLRPLKMVIENYPDEQVEELEVTNNPRDETAGTRMVPFSREIWVERDDFMEDAPKKFFRLSLGREVRLRSAYFVTCTDVIKNGAGEVTELRCTYDPETRGGASPDGRKVKRALCTGYRLRMPLMPKCGFIARFFRMKTPARPRISCRHSTRTRWKS